MEQTLSTINLDELIALFLSEAIRSRRTSLSRAAEISSRVVSFLPKIKTENEALGMLTDIEKDFEEITALKQALHFGYKSTDPKIYEPEIKDFAAKFMTKDIILSNAFLNDASTAGMTIQQLCIKYPDFCVYLMNYSDKAGMLPDIRPAYEGQGPPKLVK
jgi:hypothetical protein